MTENITISRIEQVSAKPQECIKCKSKNLRSDVIQGQLGNPSKGQPMKNIQHAYCTSCEILMIWT
jgi:hypothetical protein